MIPDESQARLASRFAPLVAPLRGVMPLPPLRGDRSAGAIRPALLMCCASLAPRSGGKPRHTAERCDEDSNQLPLQLLVFRFGLRAGERVGRLTDRLVRRA